MPDPPRWTAPPPGQSPRHPAMTTSVDSVSASDRGAKTPGRTGRPPGDRRAVRVRTAAPCRAVRPRRLAGQSWSPPPGRAVAARRFRRRGGPTAAGGGGNSQVASAAQLIAAVQRAVSSDADDRFTTPSVGGAERRHPAPAGNMMKLPTGSRRSSRRIPRRSRRGSRWPSTGSWPGVFRGSEGCGARRYLMTGLGPGFSIGFVVLESA